jgi:hypothetical protein
MVLERFFMGTATGLAGKRYDQESALVLLISEGLVKP